jgi:hypothetical protein
LKAPGSSGPGPTPAPISSRTTSPCGKTTPTETEPSTSKKNYKAKCHRIDISVAKVESLPIEWGLLLGDIVHNYRSALDCIAWALVELGKRPPHTLTEEEQRRVYFPICSTKREFDKTRRRRLPGVGKTEVEIVRSYQPYKAGRWLRDTHPFAVLRELSNSDKHRAVQPVLSVPAATHYKITYMRHCEVTKYSGRFLAQTLKVGAKLAPVYVRKTGPYPDVELQGQFASFPAVEDVKLDDWLTKTDGNVVGLLKRLSDPSTELLSKFGACSRASRPSQIRRPCGGAVVGAAQTAEQPAGRYEQ